MKIKVQRTDDQIYLVLDGENNVILQSKQATGAFIIDESVLNDPNIKILICNNYIDVLEPEVMEKIRQGIAEGKHIRDVIWE